MTMQTRLLDLRTQLKDLYRAPTDRVQTLKVPAMKFLMVDGSGPPEGPAFQEAVQVLFSVGFTMKFRVRKQLGVDYPVMPLEGLWWSNAPGGFDPTDRAGWRWTLMIMVPGLVTGQMVRAAVDEVRKKKGILGLERLRLDSFSEGPSAQVMHVGPYSAEQRTIRLLDDYIASSGHRMRGRHHEIYLGDPRRSKPEKLRTLIRHPIS